MSFDLFVFERTKNLKTSIDIEVFLNDFTEYEEDRDYNSLIDCSDTISNWAKKMFEKFPPMNGEFALQDVSDSKEDYITDYSFGKHGVYCSFAWSVAEEAVEYTTSMLDDYNVGMYNTQDSEPISGKDINILKYRTECIEDVYCTWDCIENSIKTLDDSERGTSNRDSAFITVWFEKNGEIGKEFIQAMPNYKKEGLIGSLFKKKDSTIDGYQFEVSKNEVIYQTNISSKEKLIDLMKLWCVDRKDIDVKGFEKLSF